MKEIVIMKKIDSLIIDLIDKFKDTPYHQKLIDSFSSSEESIQHVIKYFLMIFTVFIPLIIAFYFIYLSTSLRSNLEIKENIINSASNIIAQTQEIEKKSRTVFTAPISSQSQLSSSLSSSLANAGINTSAVKISNFNSDNDDTIQQTSADLKFTGLSSGNFFGFINSLTIRNKFKIEEINIRKNKVTNLLDGVLSISIYSKAEEEE